MILARAIEGLILGIGIAVGIFIIWNFLNLKNKKQ